MREPFEGERDLLAREAARQVAFFDRLRGLGADWARDREQQPEDADQLWSPDVSRA